MGAVDTTYTFTATDTITSAKMNNIIDQTTITTDAIIGTTLDVASGKLKIRSSGVTSNEMGNNSVVTAAITDANVTTAKIADANVTTAKIADASVTPGKLSQPLTIETEKATTSGTTVDFTGIPSWVKRITVIFNGVSTNGTSIPIIQLGDSGGVETTGYSGQGDSFTGTSTAINVFTSTVNSVGFNLQSSFVVSASSTLYGIAILTNISGNAWVLWSYNSRESTLSCAGTGAKQTSSTLDRIRITTINGTDTFDAGSINIMYE